MPATIQVSNVTEEDNQLKNEHNELKLAAIIEIEQSTQKGKKQLDIALGHMHKKYDVILIDWDKTKNDLELETCTVMEDMTQMMNDTKSSNP